MAGADVNAAAAVADPSSMCQPIRRKTLVITLWHARQFDGRFFLYWETQTPANFYESRGQLQGPFRILP